MTHGSNTTNTDVLRIEKELLAVSKKLDNIQAENPKHVIFNNKELQDFLKVSERTIQKWRDEGLIEFFKLGRLYFYSLEKVLIMLAENSKLNRA